MAQHDYNIANQSGAAFRADLNNALLAVVSQNSGAAQPSTTYAYQWWSDTTTGLLKIRNAANSGWITVGELVINFGLLPKSGGTMTGALLADSSGSAALPAIAFGGDTDTGVFHAAVNELGISTGGSERARIDDSGRLLVGAGQSYAVEYPAAGLNAALQNHGTTNATSNSTFVHWQSQVQNCAFLNLAKSRGANVGTHSPVLNGDRIGGIAFLGSGGGGFRAAASIEASVDTTGGISATSMPGYLAFLTSANSSVTPTEAMRIDRQQEVLIGYTSDNGAYKLQVNSQIFATSSTVATSDGRYKENVATLNGCIDLVMALRPVSFDWKPQQDITRIDADGNSVLVREGHSFPDGKQVGFIAQEVQEVLADKPWLGSVIKQNVRAAIEDASGNQLAPEEEFFGIAEGNLIAVLTAALQEAVARIETLEAAVAALQSA